MSFDFSDLIIPHDDNDTNDIYDYDYAQFLSDPIYDWLNFPEEILQVCDDVEEKDVEEEKTKKPKIVTIIQQPQPPNYRTSRHKKVSYRRGPYRKKNQNN
jgi:TRAP-type mannitol/chloroaromatic compound transport system substrate-binding protein